MNFFCDASMAGAAEGVSGCDVISIAELNDMTLALETP